MGTLSYYIELPDRDGELVEQRVEVEYDTITTDDGTAHDCYKPRRFSEHSVVGFYSDNELTLALVKLLYAQGGKFADELNEYVQENGEA